LFVRANRLGCGSRQSRKGIDYQDARKARREY
jgi:hypothetical protein